VKVVCCVGCWVLGFGAGGWRGGEFAECAHFWNFEVLGYMYVFVCVYVGGCVGGSICCGFSPRSRICK
jgi:hypothetical protein